MPHDLIIIIISALLGAMCGCSIGVLIMGMMVAASRDPNTYNTASAWQDWNYWRTIAEKHGMKDDADKMQPSPEAGWKDIDKQTEQLRELIERIDKAVAKAISKKIREGS